jgi:hypothetical protein
MRKQKRKMKTNQTNDNKVESWLSGAVRGKES